MRTVLMIALALIGSAAQAQQTWDYTSSNPTFDGAVTLAHALQANGTVTEQATSFNFDIVGMQSPDGYHVLGGLTLETAGAPLFTFTTVKGAVTNWSVNWNFDTPGTNSPSFLTVELSPKGDFMSYQTTGYVCGQSGNSCPLITAKGTGGVWVDPPAASVPELDPTSMVAGLTLLLGGIAALRGSRRVRTLDA
jgi:hypothetical protein